MLEAPALQLTPDDPDAASTLTRISTGITGTSEDPDEYFAAFMSSAFGDTFRIPLEAIPVERKIAAMREQIPWEVEIDLTPIKAAGTPTLVICGDWDPGFAAVARHVVTELSGQLLEIAGASHFFDASWPQISTALGQFWSQHDDDARKLDR